MMYRKEKGESIRVEFFLVYNPLIPESCNIVSSETVENKFIISRQIQLFS